MPSAVVADDRELKVMATAGIDRCHVTRVRLYMQTDGTLIAYEVDPRWPPMAPPEPDEVLPALREERAAHGRTDGGVSGRSLPVRQRSGPLSPLRSQERRLRPAGLKGPPELGVRFCPFPQSTPTCMSTATACRRSRAGGCLGRRMRRMRTQGDVDECANDQAAPPERNSGGNAAGAGVRHGSS